MNLRSLGRSLVPALLCAGMLCLSPRTPAGQGDAALLHETAQKTVELAEQNREVGEQIDLLTRKLARRLNGGTDDSAYRERNWEDSCGCTGGLFAKLADPFFDGWESVIRGGVHTWSVANDMILRLSDVIGMLADGIGGTADLIVKTEEGIGRLADGIGRLADVIVDVEEAGFDSMLGFLGRDGVKSVGTGSGYLAADQIMLVIGADRELLVERFELAASGRLDNPGPCCKVGDPIRPGIRWMGPQSREWFRRKLDYYAGFLVNGDPQLTRRQHAEDRMGTLYPHAPVLIEAPVSGTAVTRDKPPAIRLRHSEAQGRYLLLASSSPWFEDGKTVVTLVEGPGGLAAAWNQVRSVAQVGAPLYLSVQYLNDAYQASVMSRPVQLDVVASEAEAAAAPGPGDPVAPGTGEVTQAVRERVADMLYETLLAHSKTNFVTLDVAGEHAIEVPDVAALAEWYAVEDPDEPFRIPLLREARHLVLLLWPASRAVPLWFVQQGFERLEAGPLADRAGNPYLLYVREVPEGDAEWSMPAIGDGDPVVAGIMQQGLHPTFGQLLAGLDAADAPPSDEDRLRDWLILHAEDPDDTDVGTPEGYRVVAAFDAEGDGYDHRGVRTRGVLTLALREDALARLGAQDAEADALPVQILNVPRWREKTVLPGERIHVAPRSGYTVIGFFHPDDWGTRDTLGDRSDTYSVVMVRQGLEDFVRLRLPAADGAGALTDAGWKVAGRWKVSGRSMDSLGHAAREGWMELLVRDLPAETPARRAVNDPGLRMSVYRRAEDRDIANEADLRALLARSARVDRVRGVHVYRGLDAGTLDFDPMADDDALVVRLTGRMRIAPELAGLREFRLRGEGALALRIDGRTVALVADSSDYDEPAEDPRFRIDLAPGLHAVEFVRIGSGDRRFRVEWRRPGQGAWTALPDDLFSHGRYDADLDGIGDFYDACLTLAGPPVTLNGCRLTNDVQLAVREGEVEDTTLDVQAHPAVYLPDEDGKGAGETWRQVPAWLDGARWFRTGHQERELPFGKDYMALNLDISRDHLVFVALPADARYPAWLLQQNFLPLPEARIGTSEQPRMLLFGRRVKKGMTALRFLGVGKAAHNYSLFVVDPVHQPHTFSAAEAVIREAEASAKQNWLMAFAPEYEDLDHGVPFGWREIAWFPVRDEGYDWRGKGTAKRLSLGLGRDARNHYGNIVVLVNVPDHRLVVEEPGERRTVGTLPGYSVLGYFEAPGDGVNDSFDTRNDVLTTVLVRKGFESFVRLVAIPDDEARFVMPEKGWTVTGFWGFRGTAVDSRGRVVEDGWMSLQIRSLADARNDADLSRTYLPGIAHSVWKRPDASHPVGAAAWRALALETAGDPDRLYGHAFRALPGIGAPDRNPMAGDSDYVTRFAGRIEIPVTGDWRFALDGSDSLELRIDGRVVTGLYGSHDAKGRPRAAAGLHLEAGWHHIELWQEESGSDGALTLWWARPGGDWEPVPATAFTRPLLDADHDGVADGEDACPATLPGEGVDIQGCAAATEVQGLDADWVETRGRRTGDRLYPDSDERFTALPGWAATARWYRFERDVRKADQDEVVARMGFSREDRDRTVLLLWPASAPYPQWPLQAGFLPLPDQGVASENEPRFLALFRRVRDLDGPLTLHGTGGGDHPWLLALLKPEGVLADAMEEAERLERDARWLALGSPTEGGEDAHAVPDGYIELGWLDVDEAGFDTRAVRAEHWLSLGIRDEADLPSGLVRLLLPSEHRDRLAHPGERMRVDVEPGYRLVGMFMPDGDGVHDSFGAETRAPAVIEVKAGYEDRIRLVAARDEDDGFVAPLPGYRLLGVWGVDGRSIDSAGRLIRRGLMSLQIAALPEGVPAPPAERPGALFETWRFEEAGHPDDAAEFVDLARAAFARPEQLRWGIGVLGDLRLPDSGSANPFGDTGRMLTRIRARLRLDAGGDYGFAVDGDDAIELRIDGRVVAAWYGDHGMKGRPYRTGRVSLAAGPHMLELLHESRKGDAGFTVYWQPPGAAGWEVLPGDRLSHGWADADLDAVPDAADLCTGSPHDEPVDARGCAAGQNPQTPAEEETPAVETPAEDATDPDQVTPPWQARPVLRSPWIQALANGASVDSGSGWVGLGRFEPREPAILYDSRGRLAYGVAELAGRRLLMRIHDQPVRLYVAAAHREEQGWGRRRTVGAPPGYRVIGFWKAKPGSARDPEGGTGDIVSLIVKEGLEGSVRLRALDSADAAPLPGHEVVMRWYQLDSALDDRGRSGQGRWLSIEVRRNAPAPSASPAWLSGLRLDLYRFEQGWDPDAHRFIDAFVYPDDLDELALSLWRNRIDPDAYFGGHRLARPEDPGDLGNPMGLPARYLTLLQGQVRIPEKGEYGFAVDGDETLVLDLDGERVTGLRGANAMQGKPRAAVTRTLEAGWHSLRIVHAEYRGEQGFRVYWKRPGQSEWEVIPEGFLRHARVDADGDGIAEADGTDHCPSTAGWRAVDRQGCVAADPFVWDHDITVDGQPVTERLVLLPGQSEGTPEPACETPASGFATQEGREACVRERALAFCMSLGYGKAPGWNLVTDADTDTAVFLSVTCR